MGCHTAQAANTQLAPISPFTTGDLRSPRPWDGEYIGVAGVVDGRTQSQNGSLAARSMIRRPICLLNLIIAAPEMSHYNHRKSDHDLFLMQRVTTGEISTLRMTQDKVPAPQQSSMATGSFGFMTVPFFTTSMSPMKCWPRYCSFIVDRNFPRIRACQLTSPLGFPAGILLGEFPNDDASFRTRRLILFVVTDMIL